MHTLYLNRYLHTCSVSSVNSAAYESLSSMPMSPRSSSPVSSFVIQYKTIHQAASKGIWGAYQTQDELINMHLR
jgi:hypothetical protein